MMDFFHYHRLFNRQTLLTASLILLLSASVFGMRLLSRHESGVPVAQQAHTGKIRTDRRVYPETALKSLPRAGGKFNDPTFGTLIMRATDEKDYPAPGCGTWYSQWPTFNSDNTRLLIRCGVSGDMKIKAFDPITFTLGPTLRTQATITNGHSLQWQGATWSRSDPDLMFVNAAYYNPDYPTVSGMKLYSYRPSSNTVTLIKDFTSLAPGKPDYLFEMHIAQDGKDDLFTFMQYRIGWADNPLYFIVWRRSSDKVLQHILNSKIDANAAAPDKSGRWIWFALNKTQSDGARHKILDLQTNTWQTIYWKANDDSPSHGDAGTGTNVGKGNFSGGFNFRSLSNPHKSSILFDFKDANGVLDWSNDQHTSLYADDESWVTIGLYDESDAHDTGAFENEIMQIAMDGSQRIRRLFHHRSRIDSKTETTGYWAVPKPTISKDGKFIAFTSNWGNSGRYDLFIAKIDPAPRLSNIARTPPSAPSSLVRQRRVTHAVPVSH